MNISLKIGKCKFENPVTVASGTFGYNKKYFKAAQLKSLGAIIPKTITLKAQEGNTPPRIVETPSGMLNAIGIENLGVDYFIQEKLPDLKGIGVPVIVSVLGHTQREFKVLTEKLNAAKGVSALELNLSCPNLRKKRLVAQDPKAAAKIIRMVKKSSQIPVIAKLSPNVTDITEIAKAVEAAGADGISMINTFMGMAIDINSRKSKLGNITGGLSGPAIRPAAVYMVYKTAQAVKIPIIAMGGITNAQDALEFIIAGATMVAVGTYNFVDPNAPGNVLKGIKAYMRENKIKNLKDIRKSLL